MERATSAELREYIDLMIEKKVIQIKLEGVEVTLHPGALNDPPPQREKRPKPGEVVSIDPEPEKNPLRVGLRELAAQERINGREVDPEIEFAHTEGGSDPFQE